MHSHTHSLIYVVFHLVLSLFAFPPTDAIRQRAWPLLVGLHSETELLALHKGQRSTNKPTTKSNAADDRNDSTNDNNDDLASLCIDRDTINLDVTRCTWHLLTGNQRVQRLQMKCKRQKRVAKLVKRKQQKLGKLIAVSLAKSYPQTTSTTSSMMSHDSKLRYYQGYHDIACIVLSALGGSGLTGPWSSNTNSSSSSSSIMSPGMELSSAVLLQLSKTHLREYLREDFMPLQTILNLTMYPLLALLDRPIHDHLRATGLSPWFALPWIITWFAHDLRDTALVKRIFDFFIVSHPLMPIYLSLSMLLHPYNRNMILETEMDLGCVHQTLASLPRHTSSFGWKYHPDADGYVSDEEGTGTAVNATEGSCSDNNNNDDDDIVTMENVVVERILEWNDNNEGNGATRRSNSSNRSSSPLPIDAMSTTTSSSFMEGTLDDAKQKVPLQELMDQAVAMMQKLPPRQIMRLATRYHGPKEVQRILGPQNNNNVPLYMADEIPVSSWRLAARAPSQFQYSSSRWASDLIQQDPGIVRRIVQELAQTKAVIAAGYGTSRREQRAGHRRRRRYQAAVLVVATVLALCAVLAVLSVQKSSHESNSSTPILSMKQMAGLTTVVAMLAGGGYIMMTRRQERKLSSGSPSYKSNR